MITHEKTSIPNNSISGNSIVGKMMVLEGMILLVPLIVIPFYPREARLSVILMLIGTTNFSLLLLLFKGRIRDFCKSSEMRFLGGLILITIPILSGFLVAGGKTAGEGLRLSIFNAFSALSTTGYATCSYNDWPETALTVMIILMVIGGGLGSTAGGIKLARVCILMKNLVRNIRKKMVPDRTVLLTFFPGVL